MKRMIALLLCLPFAYCAMAQTSAPYTTKLPKDVLPAKTAAKISLPNPTFKEATTRIDIRFLGRDSLVAAVDNVRLTLFNPFLLKNNPVTATKVSTGNFTAEFDQYTTACIILNAAGKINMIVDPGEHAEVLIDLDALAGIRKRSYTGPYVGFRGKYARLNDQLTDVDHKLFALAKEAMPGGTVVTSSRMDPQQYVDIIVERHRDLGRKIDAMDETDAIKQLLHVHLNCLTVQNFFNRGLLFDNAYRMNPDENKDYATPEVSQDELAALNRLIDLNNPKLVYDSRYLLIVPNIVALAPTLEAMNRITGSTSGLMQDAWKNMPAINKINSIEALTPVEDSLLRTMPLRAKAYDREIDRLQQEVAATLQHDGNGFEPMQAPGVADSLVLESIAALHPGKIVMFDFWATWCHPCMAAITAIKEIKPDLKKQDVVIIYMAGPNTVKTNWSRVASEIGGIHYYLTDGQWKGVQAKHDFLQIPTYIVFDKQGRKVFQATGYPGNEEIKKELSKYR